MDIRWCGILNITGPHVPATITPLLLGFNHGQISFKFLHDSLQIYFQ